MLLIQLKLLLGVITETIEPRRACFLRCCVAIWVPCLAWLRAARRSWGDNQIVLEEEGEEEETYLVLVRHQPLDALYQAKPSREIQTFPVHSSSVRSKITNKSKQHALLLVTLMTILLRLDHLTLQE